MRSVRKCDIVGLGTVYINRRSLYMELVADQTVVGRSNKKLLGARVSELLSSQWETRGPITNGHILGKLHFFQVMVLPRRNCKC